MLRRRKNARLYFTHFFCAGILLLFACSQPRLHAEENPVQYGAMPTFNYTSDVGLTWGGYVQRFDYGAPKRMPFKNLTTAYASSATRGATHLGLEYEWLKLKDEGDDLDWRASVDAGYVYNPFERYFGLGADTLCDSAQDSLGFYEYTRRVAYLQLLLRKPITSDSFQWRIGISPLWENIQAKTSSSQYSSDFGVNMQQTWRVRHSLGLVWDTRNSEFSPDEGLLLQPQWTSSFLSWHRLDLDARAHHALIPDRWLSVGAQLRLSEVIDAEDIPLTERPRLGGWTSIRGLPPNRYLVESLAILRGEVRSVFFRERIFGFPLKIGAAPFIDLGRGSDHFTGLTSAHTRLGYGISWIGSYFTDDFLGTLDLAWSQGNSSYYLTLGHSF